MAKFARKNPDSAGMHMIKVKERIENGKMVTDRIILKGRELYDTDNKKEIELLTNDPEVVEVNKKTKIEINSEDSED